MANANIGGCAISFTAVIQTISRRQAYPRHPALRSIIDVTVSGQRCAAGKAVLIDPRQCQARLYYDAGMLAYDFSRKKVFSQPQAGFIYERASGQRLLDLVTRSTLFACNGQTDNMWAANSVIVADGKVIKRTAPGVNATQFTPLEGNYTFFVLDQGRIGLAEVEFKQGEPSQPIVFQNGIAGPALIKEHGRVDQLIERASPNIRPGQVPWDPKTKNAAFSVVGHNDRGELIFLSLAGNPAKEPECLLADVVEVLWRLKAVNALLLGLSADVQQYVRLSPQTSAWLGAKPATTSTMAKDYPEGRPLANAIIFEAK